ncbi:MAG: hypothetical protein P8O16_12790 [Algoriphagus sp.]|uniref:hypothetical protein n=1 Tax=Algoriphagus sp. TaxID=1872435 RepID=UPI00260A9386|nr:hypothetical protein [Algoriphagus sp.]MDG1278151.1 hypothetical protein [Algoriphagus sp.]
MPVKDQFPYRKIGFILILICISLSSYALKERFEYTNLISLKSPSNTVNPELVGPENLCIVFGGVIGTYIGGGDPGDVYSWLVMGPNGEEIFNRSGGSQFETIKVSFNEVGIYNISLNVRRGTLDIYTSNLQIKVQKGPELALLPDYLLCGETPVKLTAIDPQTSNLSSYSFIWKDQNGNIVGNENDLIAFTEGFYIVELFLRNSDGSQDCLITGSSFVGPPLDFKIQQSAVQICEGSSIQFETDTPLTGEWFIRKSGTSQKTSLGSAFNISINASTLPSIGVYEVIFSSFDPNLPECQSERKVAFELKEAPKIQINILEKPDDCGNPNGNFTVQAASSLDSLVVEELGFVSGNISSGQIINFDNLKPQIYTIRSYSNGCELTNLFKLEAKDPPTSPNPPTIVQTNYDFFPESCSENGKVAGQLRIQFPQGSVVGNYRIMALGVGSILTGKIEDQDSLVVDLDGGDYLLELTIDGCTYPIEEFRIEKKPQVEFTVPTSINICEFFDFVPETNQNLIFTLSYPDGTSKTTDAQNPFQLTESGNYSLVGIPKDPSTGLCPKIQTFSATLSQSIIFEPILKEEDCFGNKIYEAKIEGVDPDQTSIRWLNESGEIVGRSTVLYPTAFGDYSLIVQPLGSGFCPVSPIPFEITAPILTVPMDLEANKICPEPGFSIIKLNTNEAEAVLTEWIYFDLVNNRKDLTEFAGLFEITVSEVGTYEAVAYNRLGCEIGRNFILVEESTLLTPPNLEDRYGICSKENTIPPLDPGDFAAYSWYFEQELVSENRLFKPSEVGEYTLIVTTVDGCEFVASFTTFDACDFEVVFPTAMVLDDPSRDFRVLVSEGVTEADLYILNRQGALIHFQTVNDIAAEVPILIWDGKTDGKSIPSGTYVVVLMLRNPIYGFEEKITSSLFVID